MQVYSQEILRFNASCESLIKDILQFEMGIQVGRNRFLYQGYKFPIKVLSYQDERKNQKTLLAYFDHRTYKILINYNYAKRLSRGVLVDLLKHELAHYFVYIIHGSSVEAHGKEFQSFCKSYGWGDQISSATIEEAEIDIKREAAERRYKKLMALSNSDNENEAMLALEKAQALMLKDSVKDETESYFLQILDAVKRKNSKLQAIYEILETMNFAVVFHYTNAGLQFETYGNWEQIQQCTDVFQYLNNTLDNIWKEQTNLKGISSKNSFFQGFSHGVCHQLKEKQKKYSAETKKALQLYKQELQKAESMVYPKLSRTYSRNHVNHTAYNQGFQNGEKFNTQFEKHRYLS